MRGPDPLAVAAQHIAYLRRRGVPLVEAAAAIGVSVGSDGWDGLTWAYARCWHELNQGVAVPPERWDAENSNGPKLELGAGWLPSSSDAGHIGVSRHETSYGFHDRHFVRAFQGRRRLAPSRRGGVG